MTNISEEARQRISTILAFAIVPMSGFATDIYIPSMPTMGTDLNITSLQVQMTLTAFLISYGVA
jgi:MFS family permease